MSPVPQARPAAKAGAGGFLALILAVVAYLSTMPDLTRLGLRADRGLAGLRTAALTDVAEGLTVAAQEVVGLGALVVALIVLILWRRRFDALRLLGMAGVAWVAAYAIKHLLDRGRPPESLWVVNPDPTGSLPSGHTTTAAVILVMAYVLFRHTRAGRPVLAVGVLYALAVGVSRLYLGDHYPGDVLASYLTALAAALLVSAIADLRFVRVIAAAVLRTPEIVPPKNEPAAGAHRRPRGVTEHT